MTELNQISQTPQESVNLDLGANFVPTPAKNSIRRIKRNEDGLIEGVEYVFDENGVVDWRKMIPLEYLYINPQNIKDAKRRAEFEKKYNKPADAVTVEEANDTDLVISLAGIKFLAGLRGYRTVSFNPHSCSENYAAVKCSIEWRANFETEGEDFVCFESTASATPNNTNGFGQKFLLEMAENRAFGRAVRNFLRIYIVSQAEVSSSTASLEEEPQHVTPESNLKKAMNQKGVTFEIIKKKLIDEKYPNAESFNSISDFPKKLMFELTGRINKATLKK